MFATKESGPCLNGGSQQSWCDVDLKIDISVKLKSDTIDSTSSTLQPEATMLVIPVFTLQWLMDLHQSKYRGVPPISVYLSHNMRWPSEANAVMQPGYLLDGVRLGHPHPLN